ncbi:MAG: ribosomal protein S8 [Parcubacteria bacterium C7867-003]|nr:MAG: ribosomal protein S8 [Parcubacteria bacterium C7867-003]
MDQISDMIVRIKNATDSRKESVVFPYSKLKLAILECLQNEGYIKSFGKKGKKVVKFIDVTLLYDGKESRINGVKRVSKSSKRVYFGSKEIRKVKNGLGSLILSTPKGIMTDKMAREAKTGGEALFEIW